jgi:outer membrane lipoprotein carrier protein
MTACGPRAAGAGSGSRLRPRVRGRSGSKRTQSRAAAVWVAAVVLGLLCAPVRGALAEPAVTATPQQASSPAPPSAAALETARKLQDRYDATASFSASFDQEMRLAAGGQVLRSRGVVRFQRPGKMRWSYVEPEPQEIVADGENLWIFQPEDHQVLKAPLRDAFESRTPVSFLLGVARIERDFAPTLLSPAEDGAPRLSLVPKEDPQGSLGTLTLELEPVTFDIRAATIRDSIGNTTRVALRDLRRNEPIEASVFRFDVPYGADVIESPTR